MSEKPIRVRAPAKLNLFLHVGQKRVDGFHELESLVAFAEVGDELAFVRGNGLSLEVDGPFASAVPKSSDNLVLRAAQALAAQIGHGPDARIVLTKNLPVASGIGGGSADAAAALRGLVRLWNLSLPNEELEAIAASLGSDVPVCLASSPSWMEGRGEKVTFAGNLPASALVLVNPGIAVSTADVFAALTTRHGPGVKKPTQWISAEHLVEFLRANTNDLEGPALVLAPVIQRVLTELAHCEGALLARMSGSGATSFALFRTDKSAMAAASVLGSRHPDWWVKSTTLVNRLPDQ